MLLDYEVAHNYADASCIESNYFSERREQPKEGSLTPFRFREGNGAARLARTVVFLRVVLSGGSAENANGGSWLTIAVEYASKPTSTLNPPRYDRKSKIIMNKFTLSDSSIVYFLNFWNLRFLK